MLVEGTRPGRLHLLMAWRHSGLKRRGRSATTGRSLTLLNIAQGASGTGGALSRYPASRHPPAEGWGPDGDQRLTNQDLSLPPRSTSALQFCAAQKRFSSEDISARETVAFPW